MSRTIFHSALVRKRYSSVVLAARLASINRQFIMSVRMRKVFLFFFYACFRRAVKNRDAENRMLPASGVNFFLILRSASVGESTDIEHVLVDLRIEVPRSRSCLFKLSNFIIRWWLLFQKLHLSVECLGVHEQRCSNSYEGTTDRWRSWRVREGSRRRRGYCASRYSGSLGRRQASLHAGFVELVGQSVEKPRCKWRFAWGC